MITLIVQLTPFQSLNSIYLPTKVIHVVLSNYEILKLFPLSVHARLFGLIGIISKRWPNRQMTSKLIKDIKTHVEKINQIAKKQSTKNIKLSMGK